MICHMPLRRKTEEKHSTFPFSGWQRKTILFHFNWGICAVKILGQGLAFAFLIDFQTMMISLVLGPHLGVSRSRTFDL